MTPLTIRELTPDAGTRRFAVRLWEGENVLTEAQLRALRDAADAALHVSFRPVPTIEEMSGLVEDMTEGMSLKEYMEMLSNGQ